MNKLIVTNTGVPNTIGGSKVINDTSLIPGRYNAMLIRIPNEGQNSLYNNLAEKGMFLTKLNNHSLTFRSVNSISDHGNVSPELRVTYDSFKDNVRANLGIYRQVCENGMIGFSNTAGIVFNKVLKNKIDREKLFNTIDNGINKMNKRIIKYSNKIISPNLRDELLDKFLSELTNDSVLSSLSNYRKMSKSDIKKLYTENLVSEKLLISHRDEDANLDNAWSLFNTVQENTTLNLKPTFGRELYTENLVLSNIFDKVVK